MLSDWLVFLTIQLAMIATAFWESRIEGENIGASKQIGWKNRDLQGTPAGCRLRPPPCVATAKLYRVHGWLQFQVPAMSKLDELSVSRQRVQPERF